MINKISQYWRNERIVLILLFFFLAVFVFRGLLYDGDALINSDLTVPSSSANFLRTFFPLWYNQLGYTNLFSISRCAIYSFLFVVPASFSLIKIVFIMLTILFTISGLSMYFLTKKFLSRISKNDDNFNVKVASLSSSLIYIFSPYVIESSVHLTILFAYFLAPTLLLMMIIGLDEDNKKFTVLAAFIWCLSCADSHWLYFGFFLFISLLLYELVYRISIQSAKILKTLKQLAVHTFLILGFFLLFSSYWIIPVYLSGGSSLYPTTVTLEGLKVWFINAKPSNLFALKSNFNLYARYGDPPAFLQGINLNFFLYVIVAFGLCSLFFFKRKSKYQFYYYILFVSSFVLSAGPYLLEGFFSWFIFEAPLNSFYSWAFRTPKISQFLVLSIAPLIGFTFLQVSKFKVFSNFKKKKMIALGIIPLLVLLLIPNYPLLTGDMNGNLKPISIPSEFKDVGDWLKNQNKNKVIWAPQYYEEANWNTNPVGWPFFVTFSESSSYHGYSEYYMYVMGIEYPLESLLFSNSSNYIGKFFSPLNVEYIILHDDIPEMKSKLETLLQNLYYQSDLELLQTFNFLQIFKVNNPADHISVVDSAALLYGGLDKYNSLAYFHNFEPTQTAVVFGDLYKMTTEPSLLVINDKSDLLGSKLLPVSIVLMPYDYTNHFDPKSFWSKSLPTPTFRNELSKYELKNSQFDYGAGLVFTSSPFIYKPKSLKDQEVMINYNFEENVENWTASTETIQLASLSEKSYQGNSSLKVELQKSSFGWKALSSPLISIKYGELYNWELYIQGENAHKVHLKMMEYDENRNLVRASYLSSIGNGNFSWKKPSFNFSPTSTETAYMQLQIWHGHETNQPLPNKIWLDEVKIYNLTDYLVPNSLEIPFTLQETGNYYLYIRYFQNKEGGLIDLSIDGKPIEEINTKNQIGKFTWDEIGNLELSSGDHKLILENKAGFNAVNLFALVTEEELTILENEIENTFKEKRIITILEAESNTHFSNAETTKRYGGEASNGIALSLDLTSRVGSEIEVFRTDDYTIAIRSKGKLNVTLGENMFVVNSPTLDWTYLYPINLIQGKYDLEITCPPAYYAQWNFDNGEVAEWKGVIPNVQTADIDTLAYEGRGSLKIELNTSSWGWKTLRSPLIPVSPETKYTWNFHIAGENTHKAHIKIVEFDENENPINSRQLKSFGDGDFPWTNVDLEYSPSLNATYIELQIWHGHETTQSLPNIIWIDSVKVYGSSIEPSDLDVIWIYSTQNSSETENGVFNFAKSPAELISQLEINPTKFIIQVHADQPFLLSFAEAYDPLWFAHVNGEKINSIPLYSMINGFWINQTGTLEITIEYEPQKWFYFGFLISILTLIVCAFYFIYPQIKKIKRSSL